MNGGVVRNSSANGWLRQRSVRSANQATHNSLAGGLYKIDLIEYPALFANLEIDVALHKPFYLVEKRSDIFPFILDFDLCYAREYSTLEWLNIIAVVQRALPKFGVGDELTCYGLRVDPVQLADGSFKNGVHLYWPDVLVDQPTALAMHQQIVQDVVAVMGEEMKWSQVIDPSVLKANGLRLPYANKASKCKCNNSTTCAICCGTGYCEGGRPYKPWVVIDCDGEIMENATLAWIDPANIRMVFTKTILHTTHTALPRPYVVPASLLQPIQSSSHRAAARITNNNGLRNADGSYVVSIAGRNVRVSSIINPGIFDVLCRTVQKTGLCGPDPQVFKNVLYSSEDHKVYMVVGLNKYCNNKQGVHGGQDVYYIINKDGVMQRCWSSKNCARYSSMPVKMDALVEQVLFPVTNNLVFGSDADMLQTFRAHRLWEAQNDARYSTDTCLHFRMRALCMCTKINSALEVAKVVSSTEKQCNFTQAGLPVFPSECTQDSPPQ